METTKIKLSKGGQIKAEIYSRKNSINGKYRIGNLGLNDLAEIKDNDIFFLETLKMKADLADKIIAKAESQGKDTTNPKIMKKIGCKINSVSTPIHKNEAVMTAIFVSLRLMAYYGIAVGIWGLVFKKGFLLFCFYGIVIGFLISLILVIPVIASQRTKEKVKEMSFSIGAIWGNIAIAIGIIGIIAFVISLIF
jgi:hypothetical protein